MPKVQTKYSQPEEDDRLTGEGEDVKGVTMSKRKGVTVSKRKGEQYGIV